LVKTYPSLRKAKILTRPSRLLIILVLPFLLSAPAGKAFPLEKKAAKQATVSAKKNKSAKKPLVKKVAPPKPEVRSPWSLEGRLFNRIGHKPRLSHDDAERYKRIFALQKVDNFAKANETIGALKDHRLMGHVLLQRYTAKNYKATYRELAEWMKAYSDHPGAQKIYDLARKRKAPKGAAALEVPHPGHGMTSNRDYDSEQLSAPENDSSRDGRMGSNEPLLEWNAGLDEWRAGRYEEAAKHFESVANSKHTSAWVSAAGAFWTARSYLRSRHPESVTYWLQRASEYPRSFYGIIAIKALGMEQRRFNWELPDLTSKMAEAFARIPAGKRAMALMDAGNAEGVELELRQINPTDDTTLQEAMMAVAYKAGIPAFEMRLGGGLKNPDGEPYDAALYPDAPWKPQGGYQLDRALIYAFIRQESKFDAEVSNKTSGATGLMQLMPSTGLHVARANGFYLDTERLRDPSVNLSLGQKYLAELLNDENVKDNLFKLAVAYNAGPGRLSHWEKTIDYKSDPLLFIESVPVAETRIFVERVLTNYWIYRLKYKQNTDSLERVAAGEWPIYISRDK
jgi:soluble lytic murein transglycosylase-like protein